MTQSKQTEQELQGKVHHLGDGWHYLPVHSIGRGGLRHETSEACVLLHFALWAQAKGFDPESINDRAYPQEGMFRADELLLFRQWTHVPEEIDTELLLKDLEDINQHQLVRVIKEIEAGRWQPEPAYTHWVVADDGRKAGEARQLDPPSSDGPDEQGQHFCYVRLFSMPEMAEWGYTNASNLHIKRELMLGSRASAEGGAACS